MLEEGQYPGIAKQCYAQIECVGKVTVRERTAWGWGFCRLRVLHSISTTQSVWATDEWAQRGGWMSVLRKPISASSDSFHVSMGLLGPASWQRVTFPATGVASTSNTASMATSGFDHVMCGTCCSFFLEPIHMFSCVRLFRLAQRKQQSSRATFCRLPEYSCSTINGCPGPLYVNSDVLVLYRESYILDLSTNAIFAVGRLSRHPTPCID